MLDTQVMEKSTSMPAVENVFSIDDAIANSWSKVAPFWPLKNLIAVNPIAGFEDLKFEDGLFYAKAYFRQEDMPEGMQHVNRECIKWLQAFFDQGQATLAMPNRDKGLLKSVLTLLCYDKNVTANSSQKIQWLRQLPDSPTEIIAETLGLLGIADADKEQLLTLLLTTLSGWASYVQYRAKWADAQDAAHLHFVSQEEYTAFRLILTYLIWPDAKQLLSWHLNALLTADVTAEYNTVVDNEKVYRSALLSHLHPVPDAEVPTRPDAQLVFCIDVRSEPFRRALEAQGNYETFGFAGFFGVPVSISNPVTGDSHASCPVLLKPTYDVQESPDCSHQSCQDAYSRKKGIKKLYQSLKYTFTTPFSLVDAIGAASGVWMGIKSLFPATASAMQQGIRQSIAASYSVTPDIDSIPQEQRTAFAANALKMMGLTRNFAPLVVFCGHGSTTENNAYATALNCGACGGNHGAPNARILAALLNDSPVRAALQTMGIDIPEDTVFLGAEHDTTTDEVVLYHAPTAAGYAPLLENLKKNLTRARNENSLWRSRQMGVATDIDTADKATVIRSKDWAQVRPEWGLAKNAAFIVAPRWLTKNTDLEGRAFLHSYEWQTDVSSSSLTTILTAPMVVAQWINAQYFFSTLDNVAFGGGSKITKNITGKIGIMQGNASDLMHGLPLQSVYKTDYEAYHQPVRLTVVVYAPKSKILEVVKQQQILQKLLGNGWVHMLCLDPIDNKKYQLSTSLAWEPVEE